ncbi:MAG: right-handed parallel beta-helix repeat-containing protein [Caldilineaceae bacterium]
MANASDASLIAFGIPGTGPHTIRPAAALALIHPTTVDGLSQPGATCPGDIYRPDPLEEIDHAADLAFLLTTHSLAKPEDGGEKEEPRPITPTLQIEIDGSLATAAGVNGLTIAGGESTVRGLTINRFTGNGLILTTMGNNQVGCNLIGVDPEGYVPLGNGLNGILIDNSPGNSLGEPADLFTISSDPAPVAVPGDRNIVAANGGNGIRVQGALADGNAICGNFIGVDASGQTALGNGASGIVIDAAVNTLIGDTDAEARLRNVIAGNQGSGITVNGANVSILGNFIGTDMLGTTALGNGADGIQLNAVMNGTVQSNLIAASAGAGIFMTGGGNNLLRANFIGTDLWRLAALGNQADGILVAGGAASQITSNAIVYNDGAGVKLLPAGLAIPTGIRIDSNAIHSNRQLGVDLGGDLITPNDIGDLDGGPNLLQNYPVISNVQRADVSTTVIGSLSSAASTSYTLQFFVNAGCDPLGNGEGRVLLGTLPVTTDALGNVDFSTSFATALPEEFIITANATDPGGNSSEFSACGKPFVPVAGLGLALAAPASSGQPGETLSGVLTVSNLGNLADTFYVEIAGDWPIVPSVAAIRPLAPAPAPI